MTPTDTTTILDRPRSPEQAPPEPALRSVRGATGYDPSPTPPTYPAQGYGSFSNLDEPE